MKDRLEHKSDFVILKFAVTPEEYLESESIRRRRLARRRALFRNLYMLAFLTALLATYVSLSGHRWFGLALYCVAVALLVEAAFLWRWRAAKMYREKAELGEPVELNIEESSLHRTTESLGTEEIRWADIVASGETKSLFLFQLEFQGQLVIPKRALSQGDLFRLKELLQKELIVKTTRENQDALLLKFVVSWGFGAIVFVSLFAGYIYNFIDLTASTQRRTRGPQAVQAPASAPATRPQVASASELRGRGSVAVVPLGEVKSVAIAALLAELQKRFNLKVTLLPGIAIPEWARNPIRKEYAAEDLVAAMQVAYPKIAVDPDAVMIGMTDSKMYVSGQRWGAAANFRQEERYAVVSTELLTQGENDKPVAPEVLEKRVRRLLIQDIGILHYRMQPSQDYHSVLSEGDEDDDDEADAGSEDYLESDAQMRADLHVRSGEPCFIVRHYTQRERQRPDIATVADCSGYYRELNLETVQIDLRYGLLLTQRTEFQIQDRIPLELTRVLRTQDSQPRAFGIGGTHNLNMFLVGDRWPFTWMDLILESGGRSHFKRSNWGFGCWDARYTNRDPLDSEYRYARIDWGWPGWKLQRWGMTYRFPAGGDAERPEQAALVAIEKTGGDRLTLNRNAAGNLLRAQSPGGNELVFDYDSANRIVSVRDKGGARYEYSYDASGHLAKAVDADKHVTEYGYDWYGRMNRLTVDGAVVVSLEYGRGDKVLSEALPDGRTYHFDYMTGPNNTATSVDIADSAGPTRRARISSVEYTLDTFTNRPR